jgi:hypothetical protein
MSDPAKKRRLPLIVALVATLALVGGIVALVVTRTGESAPPRRASGDLVKIELRAKPAAEIRMNGRRVGTTPMTLNVKRASEPVTFDATFSVQKLNPLTRTEKIEHWEQIKTVVPDAEQSVDFRIEDAHMVAEDRHKVGSGR